MRSDQRRVELRTDDGLIIKDGHIDDMVVIPPDVDDWEKEPIELAPVDPESLPRSLGQMLKDGAKGGGEASSGGHQKFGIGPHGGVRLGSWK